MNKLILLTLASALITGTAASAADQPAQPKPKEAAIQFVDTGSINSWTADGNQALYIQDLGRNWYHATLMSPCIGLDFALGIGVDTSGTNRLDHFATILVDGQRCPIQSFVESGPPPPKAKRKKADKASPTG